MVLYSPTGVEINADFDQIGALTEAGYSKEKPDSKTPPPKPVSKSTSSTLTKSTER